VGTSVQHFRKEQICVNLLHNATLQFRRTHSQAEHSPIPSIKERIPEAIGKAAKDLLDHERTIYYERCAF